jgi:3'-phosphoadenosine 5'-phosphosulfate sulfotransferase (PAPS reductase)/FAD synthetase
MKPFAVDGPAVVSFSGGRTSAYMLRRCLDAGLADDVHVLFADTGKERPETYDFVREVAARWAVTVHWITRQTPNGLIPFEALIRDRGFLPNPVSRFCTQELKIRPMRDWMTARGYEHWTNVIGIRADEPRRIARLRAPNRERWDNALPLADAGVTIADVNTFWAEQPFDLRLRPWEGNCDLCFLKSRAKRMRIMADRPDLAEWWLEQERVMGATFRADVPSYRVLFDAARSQLAFPFADGVDDDLGDCICHEQNGTETA